MQETNGPELAEAEKVEKQLELYAQDFQDIYWEERQKREDLVQERLVLQYKLKELEGLNKLFQKDLEQKTRVEEAYTVMVGGIRKLLAEPGDLRGGLRKLISEVEAAQLADRGRQE